MIVLLLDDGVLSSLSFLGVGVVGVVVTFIGVSCLGCCDCRLGVVGVFFLSGVETLVRVSMISRASRFLSCLEAEEVVGLVSDDGDFDLRFDFLDVDGAFLRSDAVGVAGACRPKGETPPPPPLETRRFFPFFSLEATILQYG